MNYARIDFSDYFIHFSKFLSALISQDHRFHISLDTTVVSVFRVFILNWEGAENNAIDL